MTLGKLTVAGVLAEILFDNRTRVTRLLEIMYHGWVTNQVLKIKYKYRKNKQKGKEKKTAHYITISTDDAN